MERHYTVHGLAGAPPPAVERKETGLSWRQVEGLARETLEYLTAVVRLAAEERSTDVALRGLTARVLEGLMAEQPNFPLSLYIHAVEVAMMLPPSSEVSAILADTPSSSDNSDWSHKPPGRKQSDSLPPTLACIEEPCPQRFRTPKELLEHLEQAHYRLQKPCP